MSEQSGYRIAWRSLLTGNTGHGSACFGVEEAKSAAEYLNRTVPELSHWVEGNDGRVVTESGTRPSVHEGENASNA